MNVPLRYPWAVAPRFHLPINWTQRLLVSAGIEPHEELFLPRLPWRPPAPEELSLLVDEPGASAVGAPDQSLTLFNLARHLTEAWWELLARAEERGTDPCDEFGLFAAEMCDFLRFKELDVPSGAIVDLVVHAVGQSATHWDADGQHGAGLGLNLPSGFAWRGENGPPSGLVWGAINLSDEPTSVVVVNLPLEHAEGVLASRFPALPRAETVGELAQRFMASCPDQAVIRLLLAPGEGVRVPAHGLIVGGCTLDREGPDVLLVIRQVARPPSPDPDRLEKELLPGSPE